MTYKVIGRSSALRVVLGLLILVCVQANAVFAQDGFLSISSLVEDTTTYASGRVVVRYSDLVSAKSQLGLAGPRASRSISTTLSQSLIAGSRLDRDMSSLVSGLCVLELPDGLGVQEAIASLMASGQVAYAEPDYKLSLYQAGAPVYPDDPMFPELWGLDNERDTDINAPEAWGAHTADANSIIVAVLDTGIDYNHPDLFDNLWYEMNIPDDYNEADPNTYPEDPDNEGQPHPDFDPADPNAWVPWRIYGYDAVDDDFDPYDMHYHGTHVAGTIGAVGNNGLGVTGVCHSVKLMGVRIFDNNGYDPSDQIMVMGLSSVFAAGIDYAVEMGANVMNMSGGLHYEVPYFWSQTMYFSVQAAGDNGVLLVAAAGNDAAEAAGYPAAYGMPSDDFVQLSNVISVASTDQSDSLSVFSNYGVNAAHIAAPGSDILSTMPMEPNDPTYPSEYGSISGTSMASPHVAGACALALALNPELTPADLQRRVIHPRAVEPTLPGLVLSGGRLNLLKFLGSSGKGEIINVMTQQIYEADQLQQAIDEASELDEIICQHGWVYEVENPLNFAGKNLFVHSGEILDPSYEPTLSEIYATAIWRPINPSGQRNFGPVVQLGGLGSDLSLSTLKGFTIEQANYGAGIVLNQTSIRIEQCLVFDNIGGGGIDVRGGNPSIIDCRIRRNESTQSGGGIYVGFADGVSIIDTEVTDNNSVNGYGGGICVDEVLYLASIQDCNVSNNVSIWPGGGISIYESEAEVNNTLIHGNLCTREAGGLYCQGSSPITVKDCIISNNHAELAGGAIMCEDNTTTITNCLLTDNTANGQFGGAIFCTDSSPTVQNCTFAGNHVLALEGIGGAIYTQTGYWGGGSQPIISDCIFTDNNDIAVVMGDERSQPTLNYNLFYDNFSGDYYDHTTKASYLITTAQDDGVLQGGNNFIANPMFVPGRLGTYYLSQFDAGQILDVNGVPTILPGGDITQATSPAVDAGSALAADLMMDLVSTRTDNIMDEGVVDVGFHYVDPEVAKTYTLDVTVDPLNRGQLEVIYPTDTTEYRQFAQILVNASPATPDRFWFKGWTYTDDDTRLDLDENGKPAPVQENLITVGLHVSADDLVNQTSIPVVIEFHTIMVQLVAYVDSENGEITPTRGYFERGSEVPLTVTTGMSPVRVRWFGSNDDTRMVKTNTVTMTEPFTYDPKGRERKEVRVNLYRPRILRVPSQDYITLNEAVLDANDGDIVSLAESDTPYYTTDGMTIDRAITITGENPSDPLSVARTVIERTPYGGIVSPAFTFLNVGRDTVLSGVTITGFNLPGGDGRNGLNVPFNHRGVKGGDSEGSAILCMDADLVIKNCVFIDNSANGGDGGDGANATAADPIAGAGGWPGLGLGGAMALLFSSDPCIVNCTFENCLAIGGNGGDGGSRQNFVVSGPGGGWDTRWNEFWPGGSRETWEEAWLFTPEEWMTIDDPFGFYYDPDADLPHTGLGGAVFVDHLSSPVFRNCNFSNCQAQGGRVGIAGDGWTPQARWQIDSFGGAVFIGQYAPDRSLQVASGVIVDDPLAYMYVDKWYDGEIPVSKARFVECSFNNNSVSSEPNEPLLDLWTRYGGAVAVGRHADPSFERCTFSQNQADMGGAFYVSDKSRLTITNSDISNNISMDGGALAAQEATVDLFNIDMHSNQATHDHISLFSQPGVDFTDDLGRGGALLFEDAVAVTKDCRMTLNHAGQSGGAVYNAGSTVLVKNCLLEENDSGREGGGIAATLFADTEVRNSTILNNLVSGEVPPLTNLARGGQSSLINAVTAYGGGLYTTYDSATRVYDTIIWGNVADPNSAFNTGDQIAVRSGFEFTDDYRGELGPNDEPNDLGLEYSEGAARVMVTFSDIGPSIHTVDPNEGDPNNRDLTIWPVYVEEPALIYGWDAESQTWDPNNHNLDVDPMLTAGVYLSHTTAGQPGDSPLIDAGSVLAVDPNAMMDTYTTRTDGVFDTGLVDIGYHYTKGLQTITLEVQVLPDENGVIRGTVDPNYAQIFENIEDNVITLTAHPDDGYRVVGWSGTDNDASRSRTNTVTLTEDSLVQVQFAELSRRKLTVPGDYPTIQEAVTVALDGDEVIVEPGTYYAPGSGLNAYTLVIDKAVTVRSVNPDDPCMVAATIIDGYSAINAQQSMMGVYFGANSSDAVFNGITIQNCSGKAGNGDDGDRDDEGHPDGYDGGFIMGGGMYIASGAAPIIKNCIVRNCQLEGGDGGDGEDAVSDDDPLLTYNAGRGGWGGFVHGAGAYCARGSQPTFINCTFESNMARGGDGGDGGEFDDGNAFFGNANYGGNFTPADYVNYDPCNFTALVSPVPLWQVWDWDQAFAYKYWDEIMSGRIFLIDQNDLLVESLAGGPYLGDYRWYSGYGAGVFCGEDSKVTFIHCTIRDNQTFGGQSGVGGTINDGSDDIQAPILAYELPSYGAGVYGARNSTLVFDGCTFQNNIASGPNNVSVFGDGDGGTGGGGADPNFSTDPYLGWGGGICAEQTAAVTIVDCNFVENQAHTGGGLYLGKTNADVIDSFIAQNTGLRGGGIYGDDGTLTIRDSNIVANWARDLAEDPNDANTLGFPAYGAGMALIMSDADVWDCNFFSNDANASGGGVYVRSGNPNFINNLFYQNAAGRDGGAMSINADARMTLRNCTFHVNAALGRTGHETRNAQGGALYVGHGSEVSIVDSILWQNSALRGGEIAVGSGFEYEMVPSKVDISYSVLFTGQNNSLWEEPGCTLEQGIGMIYDNPHFRPGLLGGYYLATTDAAHGVQSPCIDAGSTTASEFGMSLASTHIHQVPDKGVVDIGYHHLLREPAKVCDIVFDGVIDGHDFDKFYALQEQWMGQPCSAGNGWCGGADFNYDGVIDEKDEILITDFNGIEDVTAPRTNPPKWFEAPGMRNPGVVAMSAVGAHDLWGWGVEYYFDCTSGEGNDSGWQPSHVYQDRVPEHGSYTYRFRVREARPEGNVTKWSDSITVNHLATPPIGTLSLEPNTVDTASIEVIGNMLESGSGGPVHYRFQIEDGETTAWMQFPIITDANNPNDPNQSPEPWYRFTGLEPNTDYRVRYQARNGNAVEGDHMPTSWSIWTTIRTLDVGDITPPTPNPMQFAALSVDPNAPDQPGTPVAIRLAAGTFGWGVTMSASELAVDDGGGVLEFYYDCVTDPRFSSGWTVDLFYQVITGVHPGQAGLAFRIKARDEAGNETEWSEAVAPLPSGSDLDPLPTPLPGDVPVNPANPVNPQPIGQ